MTTPSNAEILTAAYGVLAGDATLKALCPTIYNHVPQDATLPLIRVRWDSAQQWDTKDSDGLSGYIVCDIWASERGDLTNLKIADRIDALFHKIPLSLPSSQSLILRHESITTLTESDGLTHHTILRFTHIATT